MQRFTLRNATLCTVLLRDNHSIIKVFILLCGTLNGSDQLEKQPFLCCFTLCGIFMDSIDTQTQKELT